MIDQLNTWAQQGEAAVLAAFALGLLTAISPCPLATNLTATAYLSKNLSSRRAVLLQGLSYTLGRALTYVGVALLIFWGSSKFEVARLLGQSSTYLLVPVFWIAGLALLGAFNWIPTGGLGSGWQSRLTARLGRNGLGAALVLGLLFALAFCPYSGFLYFGMLIPLTVSSASGLILPPVYALGTGLPVILFAVLLAYGAARVGRVFNAIQRAERWMRRLTGVAFLLAGTYYLAISLEWV